MATGEQYGFVFAVTYIIVVSGLLLAIPADLQGQGDDPNIVIPVDPSLVADWADHRNFTKNEFLDGVSTKYYWYESLGGYDWECLFDSGTFWVGAKIYWADIFWLGGYDWCYWTNTNGTRYDEITFDDIDNDMEDGQVRYDLTFSGSGQDAGAFVFYYNDTAYSDSNTAWTASDLQLAHGVGLTTNTNIATLLLSLLLLQIPDTPVLIQLLLATPLWASVIYVIWFIIISMIPFL